MALATVQSRAIVGIQALPVSIEVDIGSGLPRIFMVGLPAIAVKESTDRVRIALLNNRFQFPSRRITINLAPATLHKQGAMYDLPIAIAILIATGQLRIRPSLDHYEWAGELGLSGEIKPVPGVLPMVMAAKQAGKCLIFPAGNMPEAACVQGASLLPVQHLMELVDFFLHDKPIPRSSSEPPTSLSQNPAEQADSIKPAAAVHSLSRIKGQTQAKRALLLAAAGRHHLLMIGPPGTGKTMLATSLPHLCPPLTLEQAIENLSMLSLHGLQPQNPVMLTQRPPFRSPHHTASHVALVGGGNPIKPGELSLAHQGILFLDELPEFHPKALESLREPLESGRILVSRAGQTVDFPANCQLVAAMNPCPCGYLGHPKRSCTCGSKKLAQYYARLSGPFLDRFDLQVDVPALPWEAFGQGQVTESEETVANLQQRVLRCQSLQFERAGTLNGHLSIQQTEEYCVLSTEACELLKQAMQHFAWSARSYHRILRLSRTVADLEESPSIALKHVQEALSFRTWDKFKMHAVCR